jgi:hypothetical protein
MTLRLFTNVITLSDLSQPIAKGLGAKNVLWLTAKARTNGFNILSSDSGIDGFQVPEGLSLDIPISDMMGRVGVFSLDGLYWKNTTVGSNAIVDIIGMRDV